LLAFSSGEPFGVGLRSFLSFGLSSRLRSGVGDLSRCSLSGVLSPLLEPPFPPRGGERSLGERDLLRGGDLSLLGGDLSLGERDLLLFELELLL
jgi:hypothetical protein